MDLFEDLLKKDLTEINMMSPLTWAYVGDNVYELYVRLYLSENTNLNPHRMHVSSIKYVKANHQAEILRYLDENILTEEEKDIVRRGRNTESHHLPTHATAVDYMYSTAFEALIGYLYLTNQDERLKIILQQSIEFAENI
jgi:ribonuclease-3 family protein